MESGNGKRARDDGGSKDRLSDLPDCLLTDHILSCLGSRLVVQTSVLSRRWRSLWRSVPCVDVDQREFAESPGDSFEDFADNALSSSSCPLAAGAAQLDAFRLHLLGNRGRTNLSRWIRRGLARSPATAEITVVVQWPELPILRRLTRLRLIGIILQRGFGERLGEQCPVLEELHLERCWYTSWAMAITSPTLTSLTVVGHRCYSGVDLVRAAPRLAALRLDLTYSGELYGVNAPAEAAAAENEAMASVVEASIHITDITLQHTRNKQEQKKARLDFLKSMRSFLLRLPNVSSLDLLGFTATALIDEESREFPVFHNLRTLLLQGCDYGVRFQVLASILRNTPNLEKIGLHLCQILGDPNRTWKPKPKRTSLKRSASKPPLQYENFKSVEIKHRPHDPSLPHDVFLKISKGIMQQEVPWQRLTPFITAEGFVIHRWIRTQKEDGCRRNTQRCNPTRASMALQDGSI